MAQAPQVGCHLIVYRGRQDEDLDGVLGEVRAAGYDGVEARILAGGDPARARTKLDEYGLRQGSMSTGYPMLDDLEETLAYATGVGAGFVMVSGVGDHQTEGLRAYERAADRFNEVGRALQGRRRPVLLPQPLLGVRPLRAVGRGAGGAVRHAGQRHRAGAPA